MIETLKAGRTRAERLAIAFLLAYVCVTALTWSSLPWNIQWADVLFLALLACAVVVGPPFRISALDLLVIAYLVSALPSFLSAAEWRPGVMAFAKQVYLAVMYGVVAALAARLVTPARIAWWLAAVAGLVSAISLLAVAAFFVAGIEVPRLGVVMPLPYVGRLYRLYGTFPSPEYLVNFLAFATPLAFVQMRRSTLGRQRLAWTVVLASILAAACFTVGHGIAGLVLAGALCLARLWRDSRPALASGVVVAAVALVVAVNALLVVAVRNVEVAASRNMTVEQRPYPYAVDDGRAGVPSVKVELTYNVMSYWLLKRLAVGAWQREPWTGIGLGAFHGETRRAAREGRLSADYREIDPHSTWLGRLAETGLVGTAALALLWIAFLRHASRMVGTCGPQGDYVAALVAGLIGVLVNSVNVDVMNFRFIWLGFAVLRSIPDDV